MRFVLITQDPQLMDAAREGFHPSDVLDNYSEWKAALDNAEGANLMFVDLLATLDDPHKIAGYESFARAKMTHPTAADVPLVVISPESEHELDFMSGWPEFVLAHVRRPCDYRVFRRASTWV